MKKDNYKIEIKFSTIESPYIKQMEKEKQCYVVVIDDKFYAVSGSGRIATINKENVHKLGLENSNMSEEMGEKLIAVAIPYHEQKLQNANKNANKVVAPVKPKFN